MPMAGKAAVYMAGERECAMGLPMMPPRFVMSQVCAFEALAGTKTRGKLRPQVLLHVALVLLEGRGVDGGAVRLRGEVEVACLCRMQHGNDGVDIRRRNRPRGQALLDVRVVRR